ncbi:MAG TPA: DUF4286 family protein [Ferruginibacter sp.]|nr:DUF4286 family protein [Ferruginibacter sp.]
MIIYNVTVKVDNSIGDAWLQWLKEEHIPEVVGTGCFTHAVVLQLIEVDNSDGPTYAIQYHAPSKGLYNTYIEQHAPRMRQKGIDKWGDRFVAFRSVLQVVN